MSDLFLINQYFMPDGWPGLLTSVVPEVQMLVLEVLFPHSARVRGGLHAPLRLVFLTLASLVQCVTEPACEKGPQAVTHNARAALAAN